MSTLRKKVLIKIKNKQTREVKWRHFCYIPATLHDWYFGDKSRSFGYLKGMIVLWAKEDFGVDIKLNTDEQVAGFKQFVMNSYKQEYQDLFPKDGISFSKAGWFVLWLTKHMEVEMEEAKDNE